MDCQKLGMILENKGVQKSKLENNVFYKTWFPKMLSFNEKKIKKILAIFDIEN